MWAAFHSSIKAVITSIIINNEPFVPRYLSKFSIYVGGVRK